MPLSAQSVDQDTPSLIAEFHQLRSASLGLIHGLSAEDLNLQSMEDASPAKWHLGHTSWFFETFILADHVAGYQPFNPAFKEVFNSYYVSIGARHARNARGLLSRPALDEVLAYRGHVEEAIERAYPKLPEDALDLLELGLHHERQHQELLLTDLLHAFSFSPLLPAIKAGQAPKAALLAEQAWHSFDGGLETFGHNDPGFAFDNEGPAHQHFLSPFALSSRLVTNSEWQAFMADGGYENPLLWLSDGWACAQQEGWDAPLYWLKRGDTWQRFTAYGLIEIDPNAPVCHISAYEADAYARWAGARLPTEYELEQAACDHPITGNFVENGALTPLGGESFYGDLWTWTQSAYGPYPRYQPAKGAVGEYNGKFMANQLVLRGGSCFTPALQMRPTYRNFFYPHQRWQMTGVRLARDV